MGDVNAAYKVAMTSENEKTLETSWIEHENRFFRIVEQGDLEGFKALFQQSPVSPRYGYTIQNDLLHVRYLAISSLTLLARAAIRGGMSENESFCLSDIYYQKSAELQSYEEILQLMVTANYDYIERVMRLKTISKHSHTVSLCCNYILEHIHSNITLSEISKVCHVSREHLSRVFKSEIGQTIKEYICDKKLEAAEYLLRDPQNISTKHISVSWVLLSEPFHRVLQKAFWDNAKKLPQHSE